jgi:hypothetical protein
MLSDETKRKIVEKILESEGFKSSKTYKKLLLYLVESSINNEEPKEITIAIQVFGKGSDFNPGEDSSVRVYASNLRKKLDHYYANEGKHDKYRLKIPKGHYRIEFVPMQSQFKKRFTIKNKTLLYSLSALIIMLLVFSTYNYFQLRKLTSISSSVVFDTVWHNLIESENPKLVVLGNDLFFLEIIDGEETIVRKHYINTTEEFNEYKAEHPEKEIIGITPYPFFPKIDISTIPILVKLLNAKEKLTLKASSELKTHDLLENDIIFLGSFRSLHFMSYLLRDSLIEYSADPEKMFVRFNEPDTVFTFEQAGEPGQKHIDYCLFRKVPGPNKNTIYMFVSFFEAGISAATRYMLNKESLAELSEMMRKKYGKAPEYFEVLFESQGYSRTAFNTKVKYFRELSAEKLKIW